MTSHKLQNGDSTTQLFSLLTAEMPGHRASCCPPPNFISSCVRHTHCRSPGSYGHHATQELHVSTRTENQHDGSDTMLELGSESQLRPHQMQGSAAWHWLWSTCLPHCAQSSHWGRRQLQDLIKNWGEEKSLTGPVGLRSYRRAFLLTRRMYSVYHPKWGNKWHYRISRNQISFIRDPSKQLHGQGENS